MSRIKYYLAVGVSAAIAILFAIIRYKNVKLAGLKAALDVTNQGFVLNQKHAELKAAEEKHSSARDALTNWEKEYDKKYNPNNTPPDEL